MELALKAIRSNPREPCSGTPHPWRNLNPQESEERAQARAHYEKMHPLHPTDPFGLVRTEQVKTDIGVERLCNQLFREWGLGQPTRAELRAERAQIRNEQPKLTPQQIDRNAYRHPVVRERCPRDMPKDLRTLIRKCRPDWDLTLPELKSAWEQRRKETVLSLRENVRPNHRRTGLDRSYD
jgi:hypothetical protein